MKTTNTKAHISRNQRPFFTHNFRLPDFRFTDPKRLLAEPEMARRIAPKLFGSHGQRPWVLGA